MAITPIQPIIIDGDFGNDPDDLIALVYMMKKYGHRLQLITTTVYHPEVKARICKLFLTVYGLSHIPVSSGFGLYRNDQSDCALELWRKMYPCWPEEKFGIPGISNEVSKFQAVAYRKFFPGFEGMEISERTASADIIKLCETIDSKIVIIAQAPLTNLAAAFDSFRSVDIFMMGGWYTDEHGEFIRLGYNTGIDLKASKTLLEQDRVTVYIVNTDLVKKSHFVIKDDERESFFQAEFKTELGKALYEDIKSYWENKIPTKGLLGLSDVVTCYLATHPNAILRTQPVKLTFDDALLETRLYGKDARHVIKVQKCCESNIRIIEEVKDPEKIRKKLIKPLFSLR